MVTVTVTDMVMVMVMVMMMVLVMVMVMVMVMAMIMAIAMVMAMAFCSANQFRQSERSFLVILRRFPTNQSRQLEHHLAPSTSPPRASSSLSSPSLARMTLLLIQKQRHTMPELERCFTMFWQRFVSFNVFRFERRFTFSTVSFFVLQRFVLFHIRFCMFDAVLVLPFCCLRSSGSTVFDNTADN